MRVADASGRERSIGRAAILATALGALVLALPATALAQKARLVVDPDDKPVKIRGFIGDPAGFSNTMRLTAVGDVGTPRVVFSHLKDGAGKADRINRSQLRLVGVTAVKDGDDLDVEVKVDGVTTPATYGGTLTLTPAAKEREQTT